MSANEATIAVIDYGMGNLRSVQNALQKVGAKVRIVRSCKELGDPSGLVFPGVGALRDCVDALKQTGLDDAIKSWISEDRPFLGVCLGLQALFDHSEEAGVRGLGVFPGPVVRFKLAPEYKIPHIGWNAVSFEREESLNRGLHPAEDQFYFVHSYYVLPEDEGLVWGRTDYDGPFASGISRGHCFATQFHPEKSQAKGLQIYRNFLQMVLQVA